MKRTFNLSANIENGFADGDHYIVTPNARRAIHHIVNDFRSGIHSFNIIGSYGTGKSSFLLALESDLNGLSEKPYLLMPNIISNVSDFEFLNIVGDYSELTYLLREKLNVANSKKSVIDDLKSFYDKCQEQNKFLVIVIDEFGKVLEHAAKNNPEREIYFLQKFAEFVNSSNRQILLLTTLHQNFSAYAKNLTQEQINEWTKVKGRFKEITFVEPIEQLLHLASKQLHIDKSIKIPQTAVDLFNLAKQTGYVSSDLPEETALQLYPLDLFSAYSLTTAIQRYGQNERSLFTFLASRGENSLNEFHFIENRTFNLTDVFDYISYNFYSYLKDANADSMNWRAIQVSIEKVEGQSWDNDEQQFEAICLVKAIGLMNLLGVAGFVLSKSQLIEYAQKAMNISNALSTIQKLEQKKIIRYASYKGRFVLFEGTDIDLESEIQNASMIVPYPTAIVDELNLFFNKRISPVKAHYYQTGTPRFFDYIICEEPQEIMPTGDIDGYIELIFSLKTNAQDLIKKYSESHSKYAIIFAYFANSSDIIEHVYNIQKYNYLIERIISKEDRVATSEIDRKSVV